MFKAIATVAVAACATLLVPVGPARADTVTEWNLNATNALIVGAAQPPHVSVPHLAMVHGPSTTPSTRSTAGTRGI